MLSPVVAGVASGSTSTTSCATARAMNGAAHASTVRNGAERKDTISCIALTGTSTLASGVTGAGTTSTTGAETGSTTGTSTVEVA